MGGLMLSTLSTPILPCLPKEGFPHGRGGLGAGLEGGTRAGTAQRDERGGENRIIPHKNQEQIASRGEVRDKRRCFKVLTKSPCVSGILPE